MEGELRPRDIQARVRAGVPVEELAGQAGMSPEMVERFAAPVLAERAHMASAAIAAAVRTTKEPTPHRTLRTALSERLEQISLSEEDVDWDSYRRNDGRWLVTARYRVPDAEEDSVAEFLFQPTARFSVANNDEARGLVGDKAWPPAGEGSLDEEPTVDLADEFALARAVQRPASPHTPTDPDHESDHGSGSDEVGPDGTDADPGDRADTGDDTTDTGDGADTATPDLGAAEDASEKRPAPKNSPGKKTQNKKSQGKKSQGEGALHIVPEPEPEPDPEPEPVAIAGISEDASASELDRLFAMLDSPAAEEDDQDDDQLVSDAAAVPDVDTGNWPPLDTGPDLEPSLFDDDPSVAAPTRPAPKADPPSRTESGSRSGKSRSRRRRRRPVSELADQSATKPAAEPKPTTEPKPAPTPKSASGSTSEVDTVKSESESKKAGAGTAEAAAAPAEPKTQADTPPADTVEPEAAEPAPRKRKGRAAVPSWDEIMFGSPRRK